MVELADVVALEDGRPAARFAADPMPMETLIEAYLDGSADIPDIDAFLDARRDVVEFTLTPNHVRFFVTRMIPECLVHSRSQDRRIVREHYDRGDDFFAALLGETMIYTAGIFIDPAESLEQAQKNKMDLVCRKLMIEPGHELLDVGCGWGTLAAHAALHFGARSTGVTGTPASLLRRRPWSASLLARPMTSCSPGRIGEAFGEALYGGESVRALKSSSPSVAVYQTQ